MLSQIGTASGAIIGGLIGISSHKS